MYKSLFILGLGFINYFYYINKACHPFVTLTNYYRMNIIDEIKIHNHGYNLFITIF